MRRRSRMVGGDKLSDLRAELKKINGSIKDLDVRGTGIDLTKEAMEKLRTLEEQKRGLESQITTLESSPSSATSSSSPSSSLLPLPVSATAPSLSVSGAKPATSSSSSSSAPLPPPSFLSGITARGATAATASSNDPSIRSAVAISKASSSRPRPSTEPRVNLSAIASAAAIRGKTIEKSVGEKKKEITLQITKARRNIDILKSSVPEYYKALDQIMAVGRESTSVYRSEEHSTTAAIFSAGISRIGVKNTYDPVKKGLSDTQFTILTERKNELFSGFYATKVSFTTELNKIKIPTTSGTNSMDLLTSTLSELDRASDSILNLIGELSHKLKLLLTVVDRSPSVIENKLSTQPAKDTINYADNLVDGVLNLKPTTNSPPITGPIVSSSSTSSVASPNAIRFECRKVSSMAGGRRRKTKKSKKSKKATRRRR